MAHRLLIIGNPRQSRRLAGILREEGYTEVRVVPDCESGLEAARAHKPEAVLVDLEGSCDDPLALVRKLVAERPLPIIMHSSYRQIDRLLEADESGVSAHLFRPITRENLLGAIELGMSRFRQCQVLHAEVTDCKEALRVRKVVERAKGILMKRNSLNEEQAFLRIQKLSRDNNIPMEK
ncbi:MAG TPA: ANTAR domain-containing protein, partial [Nitrospirota bacterium]|nr:ANTAR domain-containing protein [Nitrospirota bacterium]